LASLEAGLDMEQCDRLSRVAPPWTGRRPDG
jgi:hypothetical protein